MQIAIFNNRNDEEEIDLFDFNNSGGSMVKNIIKNNSDNDFYKKKYFKYKEKYIKLKKYHLYLHTNKKQKKLN